jgi:hypothetical protein
MAYVKDVKVTISGVSMNGETYFKLLKLIKKNEPEIWNEIKDTVFDSLDSAVANVNASKNGLHLQNVTKRFSWRSFWYGWIVSALLGIIATFVLNAW